MEMITHIRTVQRNCQTQKTVNTLKLVDCVESNRNKVQHTQANLKTKNLLLLLFGFFLATQ